MDAVTIIIGLIVLVVFMLGASIGSFINVVALRFSTKKDLKGRSKCPQCKRTLTWIDLFPIFSYIALLGRCRSCKASISPRYPLVELVAGSSLVILFANPSFFALVNFGIVIVLLILFLIDLKTFLLPDFYVVLIAIMGFIRLALHPLSPTSVMWGVIGGSGFLLTLWLITRGAGIGLGDVKILIPLGMIFGAMGAFALLLVAFIVGGAFGTVLLITKRATPKTAIPFGPFLTGVAIMFILFPAIPQFIQQFVLPY